VQKTSFGAVQFYVIAPARDISRVSGLLGVVRAPPGKMAHHKQALIGAAHGKHIVLPRAMPLRRLLAGQRDGQDQAAPAQEQLAGETDLARLRRRRVDQSGRRRNPRPGRKLRLVASLRALRLRDLDRKGRGLPGVAEAMDLGDLRLP
jgi:hypothetical protein